MEGKQNWGRMASGKTCIKLGRKEERVVGGMADIKTGSKE
jgi:hypothetical protein